MEQQRTKDEWIKGNIDHEAYMLGQDLPHVAEVYSPPRVTARARCIGLSPCVALDLIVNDPVDGLPYDHSNPIKQERARQLVETIQPVVLRGSPPMYSVQHFI